MSTLPDVTEQIGDGALGLVPQSTDNVVLKVGICSQGTANEIYSFNDKNTLVETLGAGPLVDALALSLDIAGGPVLGARIASSTAGACGSVTQVGTGVAVLVASGAAYDSYDVKVKITRGGATLAAVTAAFIYSLDGGNTWSQEVAVPVGGVYVIPGTNVTLTFTDGSGTDFVVGDVYSFATTAPLFDLTALESALAAILTDTRLWDCVHVVGPAATVSAAASMAAALDTILAGAAANFRYAFAIIEVPHDTDANVIAGFASTTSKRVMACADTATLLSTVTGLELHRSSAWEVAARIAQVPIHEDLGRVATGALTGVLALQRDEQVTPALDAARLTTLRTIIGMPGFWITQGRMLAPPGSDFTFVQNRRVMDKACTIARAALLHFLNDSLVLQTDTDQNPGAVTEKQARTIEAYVNSELTSGLAGHVTKAYVLVDRTHNVNADQELPVKVRVQPFGYAKFITVDIAFENPALQAS